MVSILLGALHRAAFRISKLRVIHQESVLYNHYKLSRSGSRLHCSSESPGGQRAGYVGVEKTQVSTSSAKLKNASVLQTILSLPPNRPRSHALPLFLSLGLE